ncbi:putative transposase [Histomonas meleagridis]|uniref:putative transposase n=1 Tax=Histomonas meleagridis TaxID=135588 RepID=UPI00355A7EE4|nr:putative transposase [Histomonas meleagridis]KAH0803483.1 putative transposase [Histomonas meleagridis]
MSRKTLENEVLQSGIRIGEDIIIRYQESAYASMEIISEHINDVFLVYIQNLRNDLKFRDKPAVLICDNCASHFDNAVVRKLTQNNVRLVTIPPHSSHLFQPLDLVTFGVYKNEIRSTTSKYENGTQLDRIARVLSAIERATTSENNRNAFYRAGLEIDTSNDPHTVVIYENKLKQKIEENCLIDSPISPSTKTFGFINKK